MSHKPANDQITFGVALGNNSLPPCKHVLKIISPLHRSDKLVSRFPINRPLDSCCHRQGIIHLRKIVADFYSFRKQRIYGGKTYTKRYFGTANHIGKVIVGYGRTNIVSPKKEFKYLIEKSGGYATASATVAWASAARWVMRAAKAGIW